MTTKALREFMLWLRKERIGYTTISVGGITIDGVVDGKLERAQPSKTDRRQTMYEQFGGDLIKSAQAPAAAVTDEERID